MPRSGHPCSNITSLRKDFFAPAKKLDHITSTVANLQWLPVLLRCDLNVLQPYSQNVTWLSTFLSSVSGTIRSIPRPERATCLLSWGFQDLKRGKRVKQRSSFFFIYNSGIPYRWKEEQFTL